MMLYMFTFLRLVSFFKRCDRIQIPWPLKDKVFLVLGEQELELKNHGLGEENKIWI